MRYISSLIIILGVLLGLPAFGQTQQGHVKTLGRPDKKGEPLSGVSIRVKGEHNYVLSEKDGTLTLLLTGKKNGDAYTLQEVKKKGYELNETDVIGRQYAYSDKVPLTIVMVSSAQLQADKQRIENNAFKVAEKNYKTKLELLEKQKANNAITEEQYRKELLDLQDKFEKYQLLIDGLAEHYAHVDYDGLNDKEREVNICIENGDLERADSLIKIMFDPIDVLKRNQEALSRLEQQVSQAKDIITQANEDMAAVLKQQEKDANYLYQLYTISLAKFDIDKAYHYIAIRADLDSANIVWQFDAGRAAKQVADYNRAMLYYERVLKHSLLTCGEDNYTIVAYGEISSIFNKRGELDTALNYLNSALKLSIMIGDSISISNVYASFGNIYNNQGNYQDAFDAYFEALKIRNIIKEKDDDAFIKICSGIGLVCDKLGRYDKALDFHQKAVAILERTRNTNIDTYTGVYNNLGLTYSHHGNYQNALDSYRKVLDIQTKMLGVSHPDVARTYNNIGATLREMGNISESKDYYINALRIREVIFGLFHPDVANSYNNVGTFFAETGDTYKGLEFHKKALDIREKLLDSNHPDVARSYYNIGCLLLMTDDYDQALFYLVKSLSIRTRILEKDHPDIASTYEALGSVFLHQKDYEKALDYNLRALSSRCKIFNADHLTIADSYLCIGIVYNRLGENQKALSFLLKSEMIFEKNRHPYLLQVYDNLSNVYREMGNPSKASEYQKKAFYLINAKGTN